MLIPLSLRWERRKNQSIRHLVFEKDNSLDKETIENINSIVRYATSGGVPVVFTNSPHKNGTDIFIKKNKHFEWPRVRIAIEGAIKLKYPDALFQEEEDP